MITRCPISGPQFVILEGIQDKNAFFTTRERTDMTTLADGTIAYRVLAYCDTVEEAQTFLYGRTYPIPSPNGRKHST
jgi:hypothetical protein